MKMENTIISDVKWMDIIFSNSVRIQTDENAHSNATSKAFSIAGQ